MRTLIIGQSGGIGRSLTSVLRQRGHDVVGTTRNAVPATAQDLAIIDFAAADLAEALDLLPSVESAVICAAMTNMAACRANLALAHLVNVAAPIKVAEVLVGRGTRVLFLSTNAVFDSSRPHRVAHEPYSPRNAYGLMKAEAEAGILAIGRGAAVLRLTKVLEPGHGLLADWFKDLQAGLAVRALRDHYFCPLNLGVVDGKIAEIIESREDGIFQMSGAFDISYAEAAAHICDRVGVPRDRVNAVAASEIGMLQEDVMRYTSLDTSRLTAMMGFVPPDPYVVLDAFLGSCIH